MIKTRTVNMIDVIDWDDLVKKTYGKPYSFQQQDGCKERGTFELTVPGYADDYETDTIPDEVNGDEMGVSFAAWLARDPNEWNGKEKKHSWTLELFWERNFYPGVQMIANDLHARGLLEAGQYVIDINW